MGVIKKELMKQNAKVYVMKTWWNVRVLGSCELDKADSDIKRE